MFNQVVTDAKDRGADITAYKHSARNWCVIDVASEGVIANCSDEALTMIVAGASAQGRSFYNFETDQFECGTAAQVMA